MTGPSGRRLAGLIPLFGHRPAGPTRPGPAAPGPDPAPTTRFQSRGLERFLALVCARPAAEFVDLGPVIGANIAFLGERVGCKVHVEDLYADLDQHAREGTLDRLPAVLRQRFPLPDGSVDAVLAWDVFDYLDAPAATVLADELTRLLRAGGVLLAFFGAPGPRDTYTRYVIEDAQHLSARFYAGACPRRPGLQNRDIARLFERLRVVDSVLLKSGAREFLFRKPDRAGH